MQRWRLIIEDGVSAEYAAAADAWFAARAGGDPVLRLYTCQAHCALLSQHEAAAVRRPEFCSRNGIAVSRRATGGGALLLGPEQLCVSVALPSAAAADLGDPYANLVGVLRRFARPVVSILRLFAVPAEVVGRGDLTAGDRVIAPIAFDRQPGGGFLLTYVLLVDLDTALMAGAFSRCHFGDSADLAGRITTVKAEIGQAATVAFLRKGLAESFAAALGVDMAVGGVSEAEQAAIAALAAARFRSPQCLAGRAAAPGAARPGLRRALGCTHTGWLTSHTE